LQPEIPDLPHAAAVGPEIDSDQAGRVRYAGSGARMFAW